MRSPGREALETYLARLAPGSRRAMAGCLDRIAARLTGESAERFPWEELRYRHTSVIRAWLAETYSPAYATKHLAALRGVLREAWRLGGLSAEAYSRAVDLEPVRGERLPGGRALAAGEIRALFEACAADRKRARGARDAALLALLYGAGLRRAEVEPLTLACLDLETGALRVLGKGNKERTVYLSGGALYAVRDWIAVRGVASGFLLSPVDRGGRPVSEASLGPQSVIAICYRLAEAAGIPRFSPHDLRRSFASDVIDATGDLSATQQLLGHASVKTTTRYDRRGERAKRKAAGELHVPYVNGSVPNDGSPGRVSSRRAADGAGGSFLPSHPAATGH